MTRGVGSPQTLSEEVQGIREKKWDSWDMFILVKDTHSTSIFQTLHSRTDLIDQVFWSETDTSRFGSRIF